MGRLCHYGQTGPTLSCLKEKKYKEDCSEKNLCLSVITSNPANRFYFFKVDI